MTTPTTVLARHAPIDETICISCGCDHAVVAVDLRCGSASVPWLRFCPDCWRPAMHVGRPLRWIPGPTLAEVEQRDALDVAS